MIACQQDELYAAECAVPHGRAIAPGALQSWVDALRDLPWWDRNFPQVLRIEAHVRKTSNQGSVGGWYPEDGCGVIEMAPCHLNEMIVCHEVCHVLAAAGYNSHAHDPWFARTYLELFCQVRPDLYVPLYNAFTTGGIDFHFRGDGLSVPGGIELGSGTGAR